jgi:hypothetical protein
MKRKLLVAAAALGLGACDEDEITLPAPPDVSGTRAVYDNPTGTLAPDRLPCAAAAAVAAIDDSQLDGLGQLLDEGLADLRRRLADSGLPTDDREQRDDEERRLRGSIVLTHICRGWDPTATLPDQGKNGALTLTAVVDDGKLQSVVWGTASSCLAREQVLDQTALATTINLFFDGQLIVGLDRGLPDADDDDGDGQSTTGFLVIVSGTVGTEQRRASVDADFRVRFPVLEVRVPGDGGDVIAVVDPTAPQLVSVRTRDGTQSAAPADCGDAATKSLPRP